MATTSTTTTNSAPSYTKADAAAFMTACLEAAPNATTPDSPILDSTTTTMTTTPTSTPPAGITNISFYSTEGSNGCKTYTIYYFVKEALCIVNMQEDEFGRITEVVQVDADGKSLPAQRLQDEAVLWFLYEIRYYEEPHMNYETPLPVGITKIKYDLTGYRGDLKSYKITYEANGHFGLEIIKLHYIDVSDVDGLGNYKRKEDPSAMDEIVPYGASKPYTQLVVDWFLEDVNNC